MFSLFKKSTRPSWSDKVWKTRATAWKQVATEELRDLKDAEIPLVFFFFREEHDRFDAFLTSLKVPFARIDAYGNFDPTEKNIFTLNAFVLESTSLTYQLSRLARNHKLSFLFFGHYPLPDRENSMIGKVTAVLPGAHVIFHNSLEDPLMRTFGGEKIGPLLENLGLKEDECIEHKLVSKSIARAREKIAAHVKAEIQASSEAEWFAKNFKKG